MVYAYYTRKMKQYKILISFLAKHTPIYAVILTSILISTVAINLIAMCLGPILAVLFQSKQQTTFALADLVSIKFQLFLDVFNINPQLKLNQSQLLLWFPAILLTLSLIKSIFTFTHCYLLQMNGEKLVYQLRKTLTAKLLDNSITSINTFQSGHIFTVVSKDVSMVRDLYTRVIGGAVQELLFITMATGLMAYLNFQLFVFILLILPVSAFFISFIGKKIKRYTDNALSNLSTLNLMINNALKGIETIKSFQTEAIEVKKVTHQNYLLFRAIKSGLRVKSSTSPTLEFLGIAIGAVVIWYASTLIYLGTLDGSSFISFFAFLVIAAQAGQKLGWIFNSVKEGHTALARINQFFALSEPARNPHESQVLIPLSPHQNSPTHLTCENVTYQFPGQPTPAISQICFSAKKGALTVIVGESGAGKSTLVKVLLGMLVPQSGKIKTNTQTINTSDPAAHHQLFSYVPEKNFIFTDTIAANICYPAAFKPEYLPRIKKAARQGNAYDFIENLKDAYMARVGEKDVQLSEGQKQRICLTRSLFSHCPILILDEITSSLDAEAESHILNTLHQIKKDHIIIYIAHKIMHAKKADQVIVMDQGRAIEAGSPTALLAQKKQFFQLTSVHQTN